MVVASASRESVFSGYLEAYGRIVEAGFEKDIHWAQDLAKVEPDAQYVMREGAWVIINSGFRYNVARKLWPRLLVIFSDFDPACIGPELLPKALNVLGHKGKMNAIVDLARIVCEEGTSTILADAKDPPKLMRLPFIGKITCWHYAKVLGADVVKPDVHLQRAAAAAGYPSPLALCETIRDASGDRLSVVDSVLWRYGQQQKERGWPEWNALLNGTTNEGS